MFINKWVSDNIFKTSYLTMASSSLKFRRKQAFTETGLAGHPLTNETILPSFDKLRNMSSKIIDGSHEHHSDLNSAKGKQEVSDSHDLTKKRKFNKVASIILLLLIISVFNMFILYILNCFHFSLMILFILLGQYF